MPTSSRLPLLRVLIAAGGALALAACSSGAPPPSSPAASSPPAVSPPTASASPDTAGVDYPTGATDVVLRYEEGGGFAPLEWSLASAPIFTLYGDGTVVFRDMSAQPPPEASGLMRYPAFVTGRLSPQQTDELLQFAVTEGGLAAARDRYDNPMIADAGSAIFTINAGGRSKQVTVTALSEGDTSAPDQLSRSQFLKLAERLRGFAGSGDVTTSAYVPERWRVHLLEAQGVAPAAVHPWPWPDLAPAEFKGDGDITSRAMSAHEIAKLSLDDVSGGFMGYYVKGPDGKLYSLVVRPLLPGEDA